MTLDPNEAAAALQSVRTARRRSETMEGYSAAGTTVIGWGVVWLVCNLLTQFVAWGWQSWMVGIPAGVIWSIVQSRGGPSDWRIPATIFIGFGFLALVMSVTGAGAGDPRTHNVLVSLLVAGAYWIVGVWAGTRYLLLGAAMTAAILVGWFLFPAWLYLWLGIGGGGVLILGGLWMRRA